MINPFYKIPLIQENKKDTVTPYITVPHSNNRSKETSEVNNPLLPVINQGLYPTCVGVSGKKIAESFLNINELSAMWLYKQAQLMDEIQGESYLGTSIYGAISTLNKVGICSEQYCPYTEESFKSSLSEQAKSDASSKKIYSFFQVEKNIDTIKKLINAKKPLWISIPIHDAFYNPIYGVINKNYTKGTLWGSHALLLTGYKFINNDLYFILQNSWGEQYGDKGFCYVCASEFIQYATHIYCANESNKKPKLFFLQYLNTFIKFVRNLFYKH